ncbi:MAG: hypothetical protein KBT36_11855 [Kurthia sp.]|nr:hypothetical protein [Candidatus Kurthia equi]
MSEVGLFLKELRDIHNEDRVIMATKLNIKVSDLEALEQLHELPQSILNAFIAAYDLLLAGDKIFVNCACKNCHIPVPIGHLFCTEHSSNFMVVTRSYKEHKHSLIDERYARLINLPKEILRKKVKALSY